MNPGAHALRAAARDGATAEAQVKLAAGARETAVLTLRTLQASPASSPPATGAPPVPEGPLPGEPPESGGGGGGVGRTLGWTAAGLGVGGLVVGTVFVVINRSKRTEANDLCAGGVCPVADKSHIQSLDQQADTAATAAWVGYGAGGALLATGIVLLLTSSGAKNKGASAGWHPWVGAASCGVAGAF